MANNKMLIDATHPEETRVVVLRNGRVEEFDYESAARKQLRGNIYLAKVTRVEPALQAAFVDYGGNRHGFLAFNEIHPDYYQIPVADRQALLDEEAAAEAEEEAAADARAERMAKRRSRGRGRASSSDADGAAAATEGDVVSSDEDADDARDMDDDDSLVEVIDDSEDDGASEVVELDPVGGDEPADIENGESSHSDHDVVDDDDEGSEEDDGTPPVTLSEDTGIDNDVIIEELPGDDPEQPSETGEPDEETAAASSGETEPTDAQRGSDADEQADPVTVAEGQAESPVVAQTGASGSDAEGGVEDSAAGGSVEGEASASVQEGAPGEDGPDEVVSGAAEPETLDDTGSGDALEELPARPRRRPRTYKIQEVIKRRQVLLIQVVKEERGNKGAALTTYLSLAGRYTVLMPNTARGGGISRKITNPQDRKRLKAIAEELDVPEGMGLIIRTAGAARTKQEIRRDFEYLLRLWESVRDLTLESSAPSLVYEEGDLVKRSIRDLYNKDVDEVVVAGAAGHKDAKDFMRMLMPSHAKNVVLHQDPESLFTKHGIERQLNAMFSPYVTLKSGGYLVINQTEALVAIDVNSGKATREFSIEETALNTNLEASDEIARQLKLRDLAGLVVIDFIDMEEKRNNRAVERRLKDALRYDRARIQLGRISHFGLMEMSRQRLRTGVLEGSTSQCPHCQGTGIIRSTESIALAVLRGIEDALTSGVKNTLVATMTQSVALYILNNKRSFINEMEALYGVAIMVQASDKLQGANFQIERGAGSAPPATRRSERAAVNMDWGFEGNSAGAAADDAARGGVDSDDGESGAANRDGGRRRRRRRGRRSGTDGMRRSDRLDGATDEDGASLEGGDGNRIEEQPAHVNDAGSSPELAAAEGDGAPADDQVHADGEGDEASQGGRRRRRGRRGGRRGRERSRGANGAGARDDVAAASDVAPESSDGLTDRTAASDTTQPAREDGSVQAAGVGEDSSKPAGTGEQPERMNGSADGSGAASDVSVTSASSKSGAPVRVREVNGGSGSDATSDGVETSEAQESAAVKRSRALASSEPAEPKLERVVISPDAEGNGDDALESSQPARRGWWQRRLGN